MINTLITISELAPVGRRSFKAFRRINDAVHFVQNRKERGKSVSGMRKVVYTKHKNDVRYVVNFIYGE